MQQAPELLRAGTIRMHHGTSERFESFTLDFAARPGMAGNGHLGVWLAVERELAARFGKTCLAVDVLVNKAYVMPLSELVKLNEEVRRITTELADEDVRAAEERYYKGQRTRLIAQGYDIIYLQEVDGRVEMAIGLEPANLAIQ